MSKIPINLPARIIRGQTVTAAHMNALRESIYRLASRKDQQIKSLPGGGTPLLKLTIIQGTAADKFQIVPGYVNSVMPTLATVALDATTPPEITVTEPLYVWIKVVGTFGTPDSYVVTIETQTSSAYPTGVEITVTGFTSFWRIGLINFISGTPDTFEILNAHSGGNLGVESFGNVNHWWKI
jgi:hypothetical protein